MKTAKKKVTVEEVLELQRQTLETLRQALDLLRLAQQPHFVPYQPYTPPYTSPNTPGPISPAWQEPNGTPWAPIVTCGTNSTPANTEKYQAWNGTPKDTVFLTGMTLADFNRKVPFTGLSESCLNAS